MNDKTRRCWRNGDECGWWVKEEVGVSGHVMWTSSTITTATIVSVSANFWLHILIFLSKPVTLMYVDTYASCIKDSSTLLSGTLFQFSHTHFPHFFNPFHNYAQLNPLLNYDYGIVYVCNMHKKGCQRLISFNNRILSNLFHVTLPTCGGRRFISLNFIICFQFRVRIWRIKL